MCSSKIIAAVLATGLLPAITAWGDDPTYKNGILTIPSVNTDTRVGQFRDAKMQLDENGTWRLTSLATMDGDISMHDGMVRDSFYQAPISSVEVVKTTGVPVQVFLRVAGNLTGCASLGRVVQRQVGNRFEVLLADGTSGSTYAVALCTADVRPYLKTIPLSAYGLSAGAYTYDINGKTGSFDLTTDNAFPGDCVGASACQN